MRSWHVRRGEDQLLWSFWQAVPGRLWTEVPIAGGSSRQQTRRIDAVIAPGPSMTYEGHWVPWEDIGDQIVVIEVKMALDDAVIGQVAAARVEVADRTGRSVADIEAVAVVGPGPDPVLVGVCEELGIRLQAVTKVKVVTVCLDPIDGLLSLLEEFRVREDLADLGSALREAARRHLMASR